MRSRIGTLRELLNVLEWFRYFYELLVLRPAAWYLPLPTSLLLADLAGWIDAVVPTEAARSARREMAVAVGASGWSAFVLGARRIAVERRSLVYKWRIEAGRERLSDWTILETGGDALRQLVADGTSFIVARGHFIGARSSFFRGVLFPEWVSVRAARGGWRLSPFDLRRRLARRRRPQANRQTVDVPDRWWHGYDWNRASARTNSQEEMLRALSVPGSVVSIYSDAYWEKAGAYRRPFAGDGDRGFALGTARTARLAQCPVIPCVVALGLQPRTLHVEYGPVILPGAAGDSSADIEVTDRVLAWLERGVGRYPAQYPRSGIDRTWDASSETWIARE